MPRHIQSSLRTERLAARLEGQALHDYRAGWRTWFYETVVAAGGTHRMVTLTLKDNEVSGTTITQHSAEYFRRLLDRVKPDDLSGIFVFEFSRRGTKRVHCHALAHDTDGLSRLLGRWAPLGWTDSRYVSDLLGSVVYITKAFGPETVWTVTGGHEACLTSVSGLMTQTSRSVATLGLKPVHDASGRAIAGRTAMPAQLHLDGG